MCGKYVDIVTEWPRDGLFDARAIWCTFLAALRRRVSFSIPRSPDDPCVDLVAHAESDPTPTRAGYKNILSRVVVSSRRHDDCPDSFDQRASSIYYSSAPVG